MQKNKSHTDRYLTGEKEERNLLLYGPLRQMKIFNRKQRWLEDISMDVECLLFFLLEYNNKT